MRFHTFLVTGVEVLQLGGQHWESNAWPLEHWHQHKGRFRLFTIAIDEQVSKALESKNYGGSVEGIVVALEVAAFGQWPEMTFTKNDTPPSFKPKHRDLWCYAKLDWTTIQNLTLKQQFKAYTNAVLEAIDRMSDAKRKPKGFLVHECTSDLRGILGSMKASTLTRAAHAASNA
ncbi:hypothetical protein AAKU61_002849 [Undibacterium sp. GrIS 1.2]|uniref:hypothetical protein n=1 Tax=Undibacterium sp. GrIS 1.2 TaxID=3143933 RepID=UPI003396C1D3